MNTEKNKVFGVYMPSILTLKVGLHIQHVGSMLKQNLEKALSYKIEGKCIAEGYIKPSSSKIVSYSSGNVNGEMIEFQVVFECLICQPVEGMLIDCKVKTITKAGIHAEVIDNEGNIPLTIFVARDHHISDKFFSNIKDNATIKVSTIGTRFELNDPYISVIAKLVEVYNENEDKKLKPAIIVND
tara:strand:+ start:222 stop:776 length:555 start_codon:yes stop_codon:yes gene_type:complete